MLANLYGLRIRNNMTRYDFKLLESEIIIGPVSVQATFKFR